MSLNVWYSKLEILSPKIWNIVPKELRQIDNIENSKSKLKNVTPKVAPVNFVRRIYME